MALFSDDMCLLSGPPSTASKTSQSSPSPSLVYPLTKSQEGMFVEFQAEPTSTKYNLTLEWDLQQNREDVVPSIDQVLRVIGKLSKRHAVLRSMITHIDRKPYLQEYAADAVNPEIRIVHRDEGAVPELAVKRILRRSFNLRNELPARWVILRDAEAFRVYIVGHHIIVDGQSMTIISKEFLELLDNPEAELKPATEFSIMHMAERAMAGSQTYDAYRQVFLNQARGMNTAPWPKQHVTKNPNGHDYRKIDSWSTFAKSDLEEWSQLFKTSWFRVAVSLVGLLVADKTQPQLGRDEVLSVGFGSRPKDMMSCVGQFANALPCKIPLWQAVNGDRSFKSLVSAVGKNISAVKKAELFPAVEVVKAARDANIDYKPPRVAVTYSPKLAKSECRLFPVEGSWDLFFCFLEYEEDVKLGVIYNPQIFSDVTISRMKTQFEQLNTLSKVDQVGLDEMLDWLPTYPSLPSAPTTNNPHKHLHHYFDAHAESNPKAIALSSDELNHSLTYGDLYASSEQKAKILQYQGVKPGDKVLLQLIRGFKVLEWILAVLKSGAAFVYLDPDFTEAQKTAIVENCKPALIIDDDLADELVTSPPADLEQIDVHGTKYGTADEDLAYMIFTSGSTGQPKGVMIEHGSIAAFVQAATSTYECGFGTRVLQLASFSFDASILEWSTALCSGATLCFAEYPKQLVGDYLADVIEDNQVSFMQITPTALETLPLSREYPSLHQISIGGEAPSREIFAKWHDRVNLVNAYGPTEGAVAVTFYCISKEDDLPEFITAGHPTPGTTIYVCSEDFTSVMQPSCQGEICLAGPQVARGYSEQPQITSKQFAVHPNGVRMYRTGDRGALSEDGTLMIMGRIDRDLKIRGFRIAPEEVEKAILDANAGVQQVSVQPSEQGLEMEAFIAPDNVSRGDILAALKHTLPSYKIPSKFHLVPDLPKSVAGKTDHKAVKSICRELTQNQEPPPLTRSQSSTDEEADLETTSFDDEDLVTKLWQEVLDVSDAPPADVNFFDIGGHSLLVPKLQEKLKATFPNKAVRLTDLFHQSTVKKQAALFGSGSTSVKKGRSTRQRKPKVAKKRLSNMSSMSTLNSQDTPAADMTPSTSVSEPVDGAPGIAIVGMAGRFPGAKNVDDFYDKLMKGYSGIVDSSLVERETLPGNMWVPRAGCLQDIEELDHDFWHLTREEATEMDPQQRLFLETAYEAMVDAGLDMASKDGSRIGIFVGSAESKYHLYTESVATDPFLKENRGFVAPSLSARTAYHLNISGPNVTVQTNCASSTVALSLAYDAIRAGRCDTAIVGGVSIALYEQGYITQEGQIFSATGECHPFDTRADGTVPADAVTAVVLKRYSEAAASNTKVYAKIMGTGIGSDGAVEKAGYQVPSPRGQAEVIKAAWKMAGMKPDNLRYSEIHGSGTPIGDALELEGLNLAIKELGGTDKDWTVGSIKGNIGNAQHASGLVSLIKICKSMANGIVPATKGIEEPNDMINRSLPLELARNDTTLERDDILAVSASGWGGVNSHLVLAFPEERLQKRQTVLVPSDTWSREVLAAPRINPLPEVEQTTEESSEEITHAAMVYARCASDLLGVEVDVNSDLKKEHGLDSMKYMAMMKTASLELSRPPIGANGMILPVCSPMALAELYEESED